MSQPAYWQQYAADSVDVPTFNPAPAAPTREPSLNPTPLPKLREEPKQDEKKSDGAPIALMEAAPVINASAVVEEEPTEKDKKKKEKSDETEGAAPNLKK